MTQHHSALAHQFDTLEQQKESATLGMWSFLATEIMLFGGIFMAYFAYRWAYPEVFVEGSHHLDMVLGTINTVVLLCSSLTVALAVNAAEGGRRMTVVWLLLVTIVLGLAFLGIKGVEYYAKFSYCLAPASHECLVPGRWFHFPEEGAAAGAYGASEAGVHGEAEAGAHGAEATRVEETSITTSTASRPHQLFFLLYFIATGLHAVHMVIGISVIGVIAWLAWIGRFSKEYYNPVEIGGLYWHLVDIVWVFLFPLFYLIH
ncbi:MAG: cytochrome c oxidase subunit 3 family protein [Chloroflexales bacterium]|nr:cytochrome c oxidase subunit 3 family protein [Chloroflexales bacterium]